MNQKTELTGGGQHWTADFGVFHNISDDSYKRGFADGVEQGVHTEYDRFWDIYQSKGNRYNYDHAFASDYWNAEIFQPKHRLAVQSAYMMFRNNRNSMDLVQHLENLGITLEFRNCTQFQYAFQGCGFTRIGKVDMTQATHAVSATFASSVNLKTIDTIISAETTRYDNPFTECPALEDITFEGIIGRSISFADSPKLTGASVQSILDHLKDLTDQAAQTLTFHAGVGARLTDAQKATVTAKNWTLVY